MERRTHSAAPFPKGTMRKLGGYLFFFGVGSVILHFIQMEFILLMWIETWGDTTGWVIRGVMIGGGGLLWLAGRNRAPE